MNIRQQDQNNYYVLQFWIERWKKKTVHGLSQTALFKGLFQNNVNKQSNSLVLIQWQPSEAERNSLKDVGGMRRLEKGRRDHSQMQELQFVLKIILLGMDNWTAC